VGIIGSVFLFNSRESRIADHGSLLEEMVSIFENRETAHVRRVQDEQGNVYLVFGAEEFSNEEALAWLKD
jgi:hypothetical protein